MKNRVSVLMVLFASFVSLVMGGCGPTAKAVGERAFVEAVNLKCRNDKARFKLAKRVAGDLAATAQGQEVQADVQARLNDLGIKWEELRSNVSKLNGPKSIRNSLTSAASALKELPGQVADQTLTPAEARIKLESVRDNLRAQGFVDCV